MTSVDESKTERSVYDSSHATLTTEDFASPLEFPANIPLSYTDFSANISELSRPIPPHALPGDSEIYERIIHPYNTPVLETLLSRHQLLDDYPLLMHNLNHGFPLGRMPMLTSTVIIPNHSSVAEHPEAVQAYIDTEIVASRMSGPYSLKEAERILRGPIYVSPLIVVVQDQGPDMPPKKRVCRNLSKGDKFSGMDAVNDYIDTEDFPTRVDTAAIVAETVSFLLHVYAYYFAF